MRKRLVLLAVVALFATAAPMAAVGAHEGPDLTPADVTESVAPGDSFDVEKTVHTPELPPVLDVCLIVDNSGSYANDLPNIKALAPGIWDSIVLGGVSNLQMGLATFVDFPFQPWGFAPSGDYAYQLDQQLTPTRATWLAAVNGMVTRSGFDTPESQYEAFFQVATGAGNDVPPGGPSAGDIAPGQQCNFRSNATKVAILTTDASFHNAGDPGPFPYPGASAGATTAALVAGGIVVIGLKAPGAGAELDALAAATGGTTVPTSSNSSDIAKAILDALKEIQIEVSMATNCADPITATFAPASVTVKSGTDAVFTETISVADDAAPGVYECEDWALIDGQPMVDEDEELIVETKRITVVGFLLIDEDTIGNGIKSIEEISFNATDCGAGDPSVCVNDDIADPGVRTSLFTRGTNITPYVGLVLPTGESEDEGLFRFSNLDPQVSLQNGETFTTAQLIASTGTAADENNLDKVDGVVPLGAADIAGLVGNTYCALVYDSDISVDVSDGYGSLKGSTLGLTGLKVTAVGPDPDGPEGSVLPLITVDIFDGAKTCAVLDGGGE